MFHAKAGVHATNVFAIFIFELSRTKSNNFFFLCVVIFCALVDYAELVLNFVVKIII